MIFYKTLGLKNSRIDVADALRGLAVAVVQCLFSNIWLKYHSLGPFEGIWKKLTWIKF